jgi:hypothetical protein
MRANSRRHQMRHQVRLDSQVREFHNFTDRTASEDLERRQDAFFAKAAGQRVRQREGSRSGDAARIDVIFRPD